MTYGLPLTPTADACRTARNSLSLIATARPAAFITTMAREVARYNTLQQNAQTININLSQTVLHRAKPEILRNVELLIDRMQSEMADLLVEVWPSESILNNKFLLIKTKYKNIVGCIKSTYENAKKTFALRYFFNLFF